MDKHAFVRDMIDRGVLRFGDFTLKSGRRSPYFFNLGEVSDGAGIEALGQAYAAALSASGLAFDVVFGPAYKGIPLAVATAIALHRQDRSVGFAYDRKEVKDHGEGGRLVGTPLTGQRVVLVDDVLTAGTAIRSAAARVEDAGAALMGVVVALDRQERLDGGRTAVETVAADLGVAVMAIATLEDVITFLDLPAQGTKDHRTALARIRAYRAEGA